MRIQTCVWSSLLVLLVLPALAQTTSPDQLARVWYQAKAQEQAGKLREAIGLYAWCVARQPKPPDAIPSPTGGIGIVLYDLAHRPTDEALVAELQVLREAR